MQTLTDWPPVGYVQWKHKVNANDSPQITQWLFYIVASVVAAAIGFWNKSIMGRVERLEDSHTYTDTMISELERRIENRFQLHEKYEREIDERHLLLMHTEVASLRKELSDGHKEILAQVHTLATTVRNGNSAK